MAALDPAGSLRQMLVSRARQGLTEGLVQVADADPDMGYESRADLVRELCPDLPGAAVRRIVRSTATCAEVFTVTSAPRLTEITASQDQDQNEAAVLEVVDVVVSARLRRADPSPEAVVIAWAGGLLHARQAERALGVLGHVRAPGGDADVRRHGNLERVADPASPRLAGQVTARGVRDRQAMAAVLLDEAVRIAADPGCGAGGADGRRRPRTGSAPTWTTAPCCPACSVSWPRLWSPSASRVPRWASRWPRWRTGRRAAAPVTVTGWPRRCCGSQLSAFSSISRRWRRS